MKNAILADAVVELIRLEFPAVAAQVQAVIDGTGTPGPSPWTNGMSQPDELGRVRLQAVVESPDVPAHMKNTLFFVREAATTFQLGDFQRFQVHHNCGGTNASMTQFSGFSKDTGTRLGAQYEEYRDLFGRVRYRGTTLPGTLVFRHSIALQDNVEHFLAHWRRQNSFTG